MILYEWAIAWNIPLAAVHDLKRRMGVAEPVATTALSGLSEAAVQANQRLHASQLGGRLWRNNVGALLDSRGVPVRYGLANESPQQNKRVKSGDLIGIYPLEIEEHHVGHTVGQFWSSEQKPQGWHYTGDSHEVAQLAWIELIISLGGRAEFNNGSGNV